MHYQNSLNSYWMIYKTIIVNIVQTSKITNNNTNNLGKDKCFMALTQNNCNMIEAIAKNDMRLAKQAAIASCAEDTSKKNEWFTKKYEKILVNGYQNSIMEAIPPTLAWKLVGQMPEDFVSDRYYLTNREKAVFEDIYRMKLVADKMDEYHIPYRNTALLYGISGVGKTEFGKYVAHRMCLPFFYINFSQMIDSLMGSTANNINKVFSFVKTIPCVLMLDEVDCIAAKRVASGSKGADGELERTTISIMQEFDSLPNQVIVIGATNRLDLIDEALLRRFSLKHEIVPYTMEENMQMVSQYLNSVNRVVENKIEIPNDKIVEIIVNKKVAGLIINEIVKEIGRKLYDEIADTIPENPWEEDLIKLNEENAIYEVTFVHKEKVRAESKEEAVRKARHTYTTGFYRADHEVEATLISK